MTQPTQAQIEAAHSAYYKARHDDRPLNECWIAALTAAALVGETDSIVWPEKEIKRIKPRAAQVGEPTELEALEEHIALQNRIKEECNATIERCAQVALNVELTDERHGIKVRQQIAAAIRKLKDAP